MKINEATFDVSQIDKNDIGMMPLEAYLRQQNSSDKFHSEDSYDFDLDRLNRDIFTTTTRIYNNGKELSMKQTDAGSKIYYENKLIGVLIGDVLYVKKHGPHRFTNTYYNWRTDENIKFKDIKIVKYFDELLQQLDSVTKRNIKEHPVVLQRFINGGEPFTIRTTKTLDKKNSGETIIILNEENMIVAMAADEWGATLLQVAKEYRGRGFGELIGKVWYHYNPDYRSGGYSPQGYANAKKLWKNRVKELIAAGAYSEMIKKGILTKEQVQEIIKQVGKTQKKVIPTKQKDGEPEVLVYIEDSSFIIYDKKFFDDQSEKYIYGYGFIRDLPNGDLYPYRVEWEPRYKKLASLMIFAIEREPLEIEHGAADFMDNVEEYPEIKKIGTKATVGPRVRQMAKDFSQYERAYRSSKDPYDEIKYTLIEMANGKWD